MVVPGSWGGDVKHDLYFTDIFQKESMALNSLRAWTGEMCFFWDPRLTRVWHSSGFSLLTKGFFSGAFMRQDTTGELTAAVPYTFWYLVEATYDAFTVRTTAFIRFLAAWIKEVALSSCKRARELQNYKTKAIQTDSFLHIQYTRDGVTGSLLGASRYDVFF